MAVASNFTLTVTGLQTGTADLGTPSFQFAASLVKALTSGTGANQADRVFTDIRTLGASGTENLDLAGTLADIFAALITIVKLKAVIILADVGNTNNVNVTMPASNGVPLFLAAGDGLGVQPGGAFVWFAPVGGVTVTPATGDLITITNSGAGTGVTYTVILLGTSA